MKRFSFVIPSYNAKYLLRNTLEALNNQPGYDCTDYEVIVVDDGSDDQTEAYIEGVNRNYELKYIYLKREHNSSRARARNIGWQAAAGEIIVFIDADIIVKPIHLGELDRFYRYEANLAVLGNRLKLPQNVQIDLNKIFKQNSFEKWKIWLMDTPYLIYDALSYNAAAIRTPGVLFATNNAAVPKRYLEAVAGFDEKFIGWGCEDVDLGCRLQLETDIKFAINSKLEVLHQYHPRGYLNELERNKKYLARKYSGSNSRIPVIKEYEMLYVDCLPRCQYQNRFLTTINHNRCKEIVLKFCSGDDLLWMKEKIIRLSEMEHIALIIKDQAEDTDLDIWIQLLGRRTSTPRYYPVSKIIHSKINGGSWRGKYN